jgi:phytoene dehydrogenase-like protein
MSEKTFHVVGAGLAGLSAATALAEKGARVVLYEGAPQAGGRCRSYFDPALGQIIDNGNHLVLSGNHAVMTYLRRSGATDKLVGPSRPTKARCRGGRCRKAAAFRRRTFPTMRASPV